MFDHTMSMMLAGLLIWLAWRAVSADDLFAAVASYIAFGLIMAITWAMLKAPDIALAEAAIGAGLTSVLLLSAIGRMQGEGKPLTEGIRQVWRRALPGLALVFGAIFVIFAAGLALQWQPLPLAREVVRLMPESGVDQPVTAVLLHLRAYDTFLEITVLMVAIIGTRIIYKPSPLDLGLVATPITVLNTFTRALFPVVLVVTYYLFWAGSHAPGGAFQGGAILAGGLVVVLLSHGILPVRVRFWPWHLLTFAGFYLFFAVGLLVMAGGRLFLEYPQGWHKPLILIIEGLLTVSIGLLLVGFITKGRIVAFGVYHPKASSIETTNANGGTNESA